MAKDSLSIQIIVKNKTNIISNITEVSNNDILQLGLQGMQLLESRINSIGYKITQEIRHLGER